MDMFWNPFKSSPKEIDLSRADTMTWDSEAQTEPHKVKHGEQVNVKVIQDRTGNHLTFPDTSACGDLVTYKGYKISTYKENPKTFVIPGTEEQYGVQTLEFEIAKESHVPGCEIKLLSQTTEQGLRNGKMMMKSTATVNFIV